MRLIGLPGLLLVVSLARAAQPWTPRTYPNPLVDVTKCGRQGVASWICDPDHIISYESANVVEGIIKKIHAGEQPYALGPCGSDGLQGYQVAVALMRKMSLIGDPGDSAQSFARALHDSWGVGDRTCNNGVLLLLSVNDRQLYISTGAGTTSLLSFDVLGDIIDDVRPVLKEKRYDDAVERGVIDIGLALAGRAVEPEGAGKFGKDDLIGLAVFGTAVGGFMLWAVRSESRKRKRYQTCKSKLEKLKRDQAAFRGNSYNPTSCPVCLEDFSEASDGSGSNGSPHATRAASGDIQLGKAGGGGGASSGSLEEVEALRKPLISPTGAPGDSTATPATSQTPPPGGVPPAAPEQRRPLVLPCGHAFCEPCLTSWLDQKKVTCPICRRPFDEEDPAAADPRDAAAPRPPRTDNNRSGGVSTDGTAGPSSSSRPPCSSHDTDDFGGASFGTPTFSPGAESGVPSVPQLRLRWGSQRRRGMRMSDDLLLAEMMFRLRQLQRQHPDYVSTSMFNSWQQDLQNGRELNAQQLREFQMNDPATRRNLAQSGRAGASVSFGGGSSRGGGGRGGGW